jgi:hypothetical protein
MDLTTVLTCEYLFDEIECTTYLSSYSINPNHYEYIYKEQIVCIKRTRKLRYLNNIDLSLYSNLLVVIFDGLFKNNIAAFPNNLTHIIFDEESRFNHTLPRLPCNLTYLRLSKGFNKPLIMLPNTLKHLDLGFRFNHKIKLPIKLEYLDTGYKFNYTLSLPTTLRYLILGDGFKKTIYAFPESLIHLILPDDYDRKLPQLPGNITYLDISNKYNHKYLTLPKSLRRLRINVHNQRINTLPDKLTHLDLRTFCSCNLPVMPINLKHLIMPDNYDYDIGILPDSITHLTSSHGSFMNITTLPSKLIHLTWWAKYDIPLLPHTLTHLHIESNIKTKKLVLPNNLRHLHIHTCHVPNKLPEDLECLKLSDRFNYKIPKLSINLKQLTIGREFNKRIPSLPLQLKYLEICNMFDDVICDISDNLVYLWIGLDVDDKVADAMLKTRKLCGEKVSPVQPRVFKYPTLPPSVTHLKIRTHTRINTIPNNIKHLVWCYKKLLPELHDKLESISVDAHYKHSIVPHQNIKKICVWPSYKYLTELYEKYGNCISYIRAESSQYSHIYGYYPSNCVIPHNDV